MNRKIMEPDLPRNLTFSLGEHEVILSFLNDSDAEMFSDLWDSLGVKEFKKWAEKNGGKYE